MDESELLHRAQTAEARYLTCQEGNDRLKEKIRSVKEMLCAKERSDGSISIDFVKLAGKLPLDQALDLRAAIDEAHRISGAAGEKPRIKVSAAS